MNIINSPPPTLPPTETFTKRFGYYPTDSEIRLKTVQQACTEDFFIGDSCMALDQEGLYAKKDFKKGQLLGIYHGEKCKIPDMIQAKRSKAKYEKFVKKYKIHTTLSRKQTMEAMESRGYGLNNEIVLVMPRYPIEPEFYLEYNAMLYVNEPSGGSEGTRYNKYLNCDQSCTINVLSFNNDQYNTIDYVAQKDIDTNEELVVYYGNYYERPDYDVNETGCNVDHNQRFFV